jgi:hypothetical protein
VKKKTWRRLEPNLALSDHLHGRLSGGQVAALDVNLVAVLLEKRGNAFG